MVKVKCGDMFLQNYFVDKVSNNVGKNLKLITSIIFKNSEVYKNKKNKNKNKLYEKEIFKSFKNEGYSLRLYYVWSTILPFYSYLRRSGLSIYFGRHLIKMVLIVLPTQCIINKTINILKLLYSIVSKLLQFLSLVFLGVKYVVSGFNYLRSASLFFFLIFKF